MKKEQVVTVVLLFPHLQNDDGELEVPSGHRSVHVVSKITWEKIRMVLTSIFMCGYI